MAISLIFMFYSPKPELIFDANHMVVGVKNKENKLVIYIGRVFVILEYN